MEKNYYLKNSINNNAVKLWSTRRLPFEPKGWLYEMRHDLKRALKQLKTKKNLMLYASFYSNQEEFFDVENVLLYNVGSSSFSHLCNKGLIFESVLLNPPVLNIDDHEINIDYYHQYVTLEDKPQSCYWNMEKRVAKWHDVSCQKISSDMKPHQVWYDMKKGAVEIDNKCRISPFYGIKVEIKAPINTKINLAAVVKPLLDGIICSFHCHNGEQIDEVVNRLLNKVDENPEVLKAMLLDNNVVLGKNRLIYPYRNYVKWNPDDHKFVYAEILVDYSNEENIWSMSGEINTLSVKEQYL